MKRRFLALAVIAMLGAASFLSGCSKTSDDMLCDRCHANGKKVTVEALQKAIEKAERAKDDDPIEELMEKIVVRYEEDVELCEDCADDKYDSPDVMTEEQRAAWQEKMQPIIERAESSLSERYADVIEVYVEYLNSLPS